MRLLSPRMIFDMHGHGETRDQVQMALFANGSLHQRRELEYGLFRDEINVARERTR